MIKHSEAISAFLEKEIDPAFARRARIILENLDLKPGMRVLDVGCGRGFYEMAISNIFSGVKVVGVDLNENYLSVGKNAVRDKNVTFLKADATKLPFKSGSFDRVICSEVLEHIPDDEGVLKEIRRVLKRGGKAIISVPNKNYPFFWDPLNYILEHFFHTHIPSHIWWLAGIWADHERLYTEEELLGKLGRVGGLGKSGFTIDKIWRSTAYCLPFSHFLLYGIGKNLVERGWVGKDINRFDFESPPSVLTKIIRFPFMLFDKLNSITTNEKICQNIIVMLQKSYDKKDIHQ